MVFCRRFMSGLTGIVRHVGDASAALSWTQSFKTLVMTRYKAKRVARGESKASRGWRTPHLYNSAALLNTTDTKVGAREDAQQECKVRLEASKSYKIPSSVDPNEKRRDGRIRGGRMAGFEGRASFTTSSPPSGHHHAGCRGGMRRGAKTRTDLTGAANQ